MDLPPTRALSHRTKETETECGLLIFYFHLINSTKYPETLTNEGIRVATIKCLTSTFNTKRPNIEKNNVFGSRYLGCHKQVFKRWSAIVRWVHWRRDSSAEHRWLWANSNRFKCLGDTASHPKITSSQGCVELRPADAWRIIICFGTIIDIWRRN